MRAPSKDMTAGVCPWSLVAFGLGPLVKAAFDEIFRSPFIARVMLAELDQENGVGVFYTIDADGSFAQSGRIAALSGTEASAQAMMVKLAASGENLALDEALGMALEVWGLGRLALDATGDQIPDDSAVLDFLKGGLEGLKVEAVSSTGHQGVRLGELALFSNSTRDLAVR